MRAVYADASDQYTMFPLPPDVEVARKNRVNCEMVKLFNQLVDPHSTVPLSFKGTGSLTHIEAPHPEQNRSFLPLGGPNRVKPRKGVQGELPPEVKALYEDLRVTLQQEEELEDKKRPTGGPTPQKKPSLCDASTKPAEAQVKSKANFGRRDDRGADTWGAMDDSSEGSDAMGLENPHPKKRVAISDEHRSPGGSLTQNERRASTAGTATDVVMGGTTTGTETATPARNMGHTSMDTMYDADRDPRRRRG